MMAHFVGFEERKNFCFMKFSVKSVFQPLGSDSVIVIPINLRGISYVNANVLQLCISRFGGRSFQSYRHTGI